MTSTKTTTSFFNRPLLLEAGMMAFVKLHPMRLAKNPVMFATGISTVLASFITLHQAMAGQAISFNLQISLWLWFTLLFANFSEALAEGHGKAQSASLRKTRQETMARKISNLDSRDFKLVPAGDLRAGDLVLVQAGDYIPGDGDVVKGIAAVDESSITGESAPVIRESGGDRSAVTGGTQVISDFIIIEIRANPGEAFLDRMIGLVDSATRKKTPNEISLGLLLSSLTLVFLVVCVTFQVFLSYYSNHIVPPMYIIALFVTLIPTTIGGLLSAIGIASMDRLFAHNVIAKSGRAVEAAGDVDTLFLDKTGTITLGNRTAFAFHPASGVTESDFAIAAMLSSLMDETPEGRSIAQFAEEKYGLCVTEARKNKNAVFVPFSAHTKMSGVDLGEKKVRKGAVSAIVAFTQETLDSDMNRLVERIAKSGGTVLLVAENKKILGGIHLKDIIKPGIKERFAQLRQMGIRTIMVTGDNALTAAAIAAEAGVDDFLAEATPEKKLNLVRQEQASGKLIALCGDGSNDAPALAQADVGVAMNTGTMAAREASNMVDLDSDPTKLIEIVITGKKSLMSRGALTTFSITNDVAKYFTVFPAFFATSNPVLKNLDIMNLGDPQDAIIATVIFNALILIALTPLALRGVRYRPAPANVILRRNLLIYGVGGLVTPFVGIKIIDMILDCITGIL